MNQTRTATIACACLRLSLPLLALLLSACTSAPPKYLPLTLDATPEVVVHPFSTKAAGSEYRGDTDYGVLFAKYLAGALQANGIRAQMMPEDTASRGERFTVEGELTKIHAGNPPPHAWSLFGTDDATVAAGYHMSDAKDVAAAYTGKAEYGVNGDDPREQLLQKSASRVAYDLAGQIKHDLHQARKKNKQ